MSEKDIYKFRIWVMSGVFGAQESNRTLEILLVCSQRLSQYSTNFPWEYASYFVSKFFRDARVLPISRVSDSELPSHGFLYVVGEVPDVFDKILTSDGWRVSLENRLSL